MQSRSCISGRSKGFTLLELLVVITMLAVMTAALSPSIIRTPGIELRIAAGEIASELKKARLQAQRRRVPVPLSIDIESGSYGISGTSDSLQVDPDIAIVLTTAEQEIEGSGSGSIRFFPDGSSTGGRISLTLGHRSMHVDVEWLTGRVRLLESESS